MWLKNCRSRSQSPISEPSRTPSPHMSSSYPKITTSNSISQLSEDFSKKKPIITVAPVAKLLNKNLAIKQSIRVAKRKRPPYRPISAHSTQSSVFVEANNNDKPLAKQDKPKSFKVFSKETDTGHQNRIPQPPLHSNIRLAHPMLRPPPPVTILVPYPIFLPIAIPIPIVLPILKPLNAKKNDNITPTDNLAENSATCTTETGQPKDVKKIEEDIEQNIETKGDNKEENAEQKLPKFKITRLTSKRMIAKECEKEKNRPLRKRKFNQHHIIELEDDKLSST